MDRNRWRGYYPKIPPLIEEEQFLKIPSIIRAYYIHSINEDHKGIYDGRDYKNGLWVYTTFEPISLSKVPLGGEFKKLNMVLGRSFISKRF